MKTTSFATGLILSTAIAIGAASPAMSQQSAQNGGDDKPCNTAGAALGGALIGALLGGKHHRAEGAAVGGAVGAVACLAVNYHAKQVRSSQQVGQEYENAHGGSLPPHATLVQYQSRINPANRIQAGQSSSLDSDIVIAPGADGQQPKVEEEITFIGPDGKQIKDVRKDANESASAGEFQTQFAFTLPKGVKEGTYQFKTALYVNGENVRNEQLPLQVVAASM